MGIQSIAGLAGLLVAARRFIRLYLRYKPTLLDKLNPVERQRLEQLVVAIDAFLDEEPIPD